MTDGSSQGDPFPQIVDIHSKGEYPANVLSNLYPNEFELDGVRCSSIEGFLQSLKFRSARRQCAVCGMSGKKAKDTGHRKWLWKFTGNLYWQGKRIKRESGEFAQLIRRAFSELGKNPVFSEALLATEGKKLVHSIGRANKRETILTEAEFLENLDLLRDELLASRAEEKDGPDAPRASGAI